MSAIPQPRPLSKPSLQGGQEAIRYARRGTLVLLSPLLLLVGMLTFAGVILSDATAQNRAQAVLTAWEAGGPVVARELTQCLARQGEVRAKERAAGDPFVQLKLLDDVTECEDSVSRAAIARGAVFNEPGVEPLARYDAAVADRKAVFSKTFGLNKADGSFLGLKTQQ